MADDDVIADDATKAERKAAYEAALPELRAIHGADVAWVDQDLVRAASIALDAVPRIGSLRERLAALGQDYRIDLVDKIERYAKAALHADAVYREHPEPEGSLPALVKEAGELRLLLASDCRPLVLRKILDKERLKDLDGGVRYPSVACDLLLIRNALTAIYPKLKGRSAVTPEDLARAEELANGVLQRIADPWEQGPFEWEPAELYHRAYTALTRAYGEARRGVLYLRFNDEDADDFTPDLMFRSNELIERRRFARPEQAAVDGVRDASSMLLATAALTLAAMKKGQEN